MISPQIKFKKKWLDNKGVSEIIGTILMLAITVVLFSSIMVFVTNMPTPIERPTADFLSSVTYNTTTNSGIVTLTHNGGEALNDYETQLLVIVDSNVRLTPRTMAAGGLGSTWKIGQKWTCWLPSLGVTNTLEIMVIDLHSNSQVWDGKISAGAGNNAPVILQRWTDSDPNTLTADTIVEGDSYFWLYVRVTDLDNDIQSVIVDATSIGSSSSKAYSTLNGGVYGYNFTTPITQASLFDGKPLFIIAKDIANHWTNATFLLTVSASERGPPGSTGPKGDPGSTSGSNPGDYGLPTWLIFHDTEQGYVILGENKTNRSGGWGQQGPNLSDYRNIFTQDEGWIYIRVGSIPMSNTLGKNTIYLINRLSGSTLTPPSSTSAVTRIAESGNVNMFEMKFNCTTAIPIGSYDVIIDLASSSINGNPPSILYAKSWLTINPPEGSGQSAPFSPTVNISRDSSRTPAVRWGNADTAFDLTNSSLCTVWVEMSMQTVGAASSITISDVRLTDLKSRDVLYGYPPTGDGLMTATSVDGSKKTYYFSIDLRFKNGGSWSAGTTAYTLTLTNVFDADEGVYTISMPIWVKAPTVTRSFVVGTNGFGGGHVNFAHFEYIFQIENDKFSTTRLLLGKDKTPSADYYDASKILLFDMDGDTARDVLAFEYDGFTATYDLAMYANKIKEKSLWENRNIIKALGAVTVLSMTYGDVNGDGANDWVVSLSNGTVLLYLNLFPIVECKLLTGVYFNEMNLKDLTGDGRADLFALGYVTNVARGTVNERIYVYNLTRGASTTTNVSAALRPVAISVPFYGYVKDFDVADIDRDGILDYAITTGTAANGGIRWEKGVKTPSVAHANESTPAYGSIVSGSSPGSTMTWNNATEVLQESTNESEKLDHTWTIAPVRGNNPYIQIVGKVLSGNEGYYFWYSTSASAPRTWIFMFYMSSTTQASYTFNLPLSTKGTVYVRVTDAITTDTGSPGQISIDKVCILSTSGISFTATPDSTYKVTSDYNWTAIGIGNFDGVGNLDFAVGKAAQFKVWKTNGLLATSSGTPAASLTPTGDTFCVADINGDGLADIGSIAYTSTMIYQWANVASGTNFMGYLVKDLTMYGNDRPGVIGTLQVEDLYN